MIASNSGEVLFRELALRVCSSLEINAALGQVLEYLQHSLPFTQMYLYSIQDVELGTSHQIAHATCDTCTDKKLISPPQNHWEWARRQRAPFILSASDRERGIHTVAPLIELAGNSIMVVPLHIQNRLIGFLVLRTKGENKFTPALARLMDVATSPFSIALANAQSQDAVPMHRDRLLDRKYLLRGLAEARGEREIVGEKAGLCSVMEMVRQVAPLNTSVLLAGETGTGKEVIAEAIHCSSPRKAGPFIRVNCGAIPENLIESELFGHEKGAFTGAVAIKQGRFEQAIGGTIFLDEIGEMPLQSQVRLLRVLQSKELNRVGGDKPIAVDVRIIAATHRNLKQMVIDNRFREDLWFRLNVFPITIPPLRERKEDIPELTRYLVTRKSRDLGMIVPPPIAPGALERLASYDWPGNVRELENIVERELVFHREGALSFDFPLQSAAQSHTAICSDVTSGAPLNLDVAMCLHIGKVLELSKGKIHGPGGAAELLGINSNTLRARMRKLGIMPEVRKYRY
jgi:hydrogenase-4 transcriptional activator